MNGKELARTVVELSELESEFLLEILASAERELLAELSRTDSREYRQKLEDRLRLLESARARITGQI